ncbi:MAG: ComF family protein [Caldimicrobium sp.]
MLEKLLFKFFNFLFPTFCFKCNKPLSEEEVLFCSSCLPTLPLAKSYCNKCGTLLPETLLEHFSTENLTYCSFCEKEKLFYDRVYLGFQYREPLRELLHKAKFKEDFPLAYHLGKLLRKVCKVNLNYYDIITPVPLSLKRERERGYNQSLLILWGYAGIKLPSRVLIRVKHTRPQSELSERERFENIKNAFSVLEDLTGKRVLIVDDIMTTGATLREASKILKKAGAKEVHLLVFARA